MYNIGSSEIKEQKEFKEAEKRAKRLVNKLRIFIFNEVLDALSKYEKSTIQQLTTLEIEFSNVFKKAFDTEKNPNYQSALETLKNFINQRIINLFCFGSNNETYKDVIKLIALFCKQHGIL